MLSPADMLASLLPDTIVGGTTGWLLQIGNMPSADNKVVVFNDTGGLNPNPKWALDFPSVQVLVRGSKNSYAQAYAKIREIRDYLLGINSQDVVSETLTFRLVSVTMQSDVAGLGNDENDRPILSLNFRTIWEPPATTNREAL